MAWWGYSSGERPYYFVCKPGEPSTTTRPEGVDDCPWLMEQCSQSLLLSPATGKLQAVQQCTQPAACCFPWRPFVSPQRWEDVNDSASSGILSRVKYPYREQEERREAQMHLYEEGLFCHPMQQHPRLAPSNRTWVDRRQKKQTMHQH